MSDPTTPEGRAELRRVAESARDAIDRQDVGAMLDGAFRSSFDIPTVLALLDALDQTQEEIHRRDNFQLRQESELQNYLARVRAAEAALDRVRVALDDWTPARGSAAVFVDEIRAALDGAQ